MSQVVYSKRKKYDFIEQHIKIFWIALFLLSIIISILIDVIIYKYFSITNIKAIVCFDFLIYFITQIYFLHLNADHNMSKSTAFVARNGKLYAIQLLYTKRDIGAGEGETFFYAPVDSGAASATLGQNVDAAINVHTHEKEVRNRREDDASFVRALDDILTKLSQSKRQYYVPADEDRSLLDKLLRYNVINNGLCSIETQNERYNFLILNNPVIEREGKKSFTLRFTNEEGKQCTAKFSNCYANLLQDIKSKEIEV